jgi:hypothetical protein
VRRSRFESGATGSLERHWHAVGMQVVREVVRPAEASVSCVPVRGRAGADEVQQPLLQVSGRPTQHEAGADTGSQRRPPAIPAPTSPATANKVPQAATMATKEERSSRREMNMTPRNEQGKRRQRSFEPRATFVEPIRFYAYIS